MSLLFHSLALSLTSNAHLILRSPDDDVSLVFRLAQQLLSEYPIHKLRITNKSAHLHPHSFLRQLFSDLRKKRTASTSANLPIALILSGLHTVSLPSQRALASVLATNNLPDGLDLALPPNGFVLIYICPSNATDRPIIHKTLLDMFAMSCNVSLNPHLRYTLQQLQPQSPFTHPITISNTNRNSSFKSLPPLSSTPSSPHITIPSSLPPQSSTPPPPLLGGPGTPQFIQSTLNANRPIHPSQYSNSNSIPGSGSLTPSLIQTLRTAYLQTQSNPNSTIYISSSLKSYLADLFSATRAHPQLDATLLSARCVKDCERLIKAGKVVGYIIGNIGGGGGNELTGVELIRPFVQPQSERKENDNDNEEDEEESFELLDYSRRNSRHSTQFLSITKSHSTSNSMSKSYSQPRTQTQTQTQTSPLSIHIPFAQSYPFPPQHHHSNSLTNNNTPQIQEQDENNQTDTNEYIPIPLPTLEITEANIARTFPRCVSHRLRVREGGREEVLAGVVFGATFDPDDESDNDNKEGNGNGNGNAREEEEEEERSSVKDILVSILADV